MFRHGAGQDTRLFSREKMSTASLCLGRILLQFYFSLHPKYFLDSMIRPALWLPGIMDEGRSVTQIKGCGFHGSPGQSKGTWESIVKRDVPRQHCPLALSAFISPFGSTLRAPFAPGRKSFHKVTSSVSKPKGK